MQNSTSEFQHNSRTVYTATKNVVKSCGRFSHVDCDDNLFVVTATHGFSLLGQRVKIRVVATSTNSSKVVVESESKIFFNILGIGANKENVVSLTDYIANGVYKLLDISGENGREIRIAPPEIKMKGK
jgi:hypothetical protein